MVISFAFCKSISSSKNKLSIFDYSNKNNEQNIPTKNISKEICLRSNYTYNYYFVVVLYPGHSV